MVNTLLWQEAHTDDGWFTCFHAWGGSYNLEGDSDVPPLINKAFGLKWTGRKRRRKKKSLKCRVKLKLTEKSWNEDRIPFCLKVWSGAHQRATPVGAALLKSVNQGNAWQHLQQETMNHAGMKTQQEEGEYAFACSNQRKHNCAGLLQPQPRKDPRRTRKTQSGDQIVNEPLWILDIFMHQYISKHIQKAWFCILRYID